MCSKCGKSSKLYRVKRTFSEKKLFHRDETKLKCSECGQYIWHKEGRTLDHGYIT